MWGWLLDLLVRLWFRNPISIPVPLTIKPPVMGGQFLFPVPSVVPPLLDSVTIEHGVKEPLFPVPLDSTGDQVGQCTQACRNGN